MVVFLKVLNVFKRLLNKEISNCQNGRQLNKIVKASGRTEVYFCVCVVGGQYKQLPLLCTINHAQTTRLKFMHRLDIMVSTISIVLYPTKKKKNGGKEEKLQSDKIDPFSKHYYRKSLPGHTYRHKYSHCR